MKIKDVLFIIKEEVAGQEELRSKEDLKRFFQSIKSILMKKGFREPQPTNIIQDFLNQLNSSGWLNKIIHDDDSTVDVLVNPIGSNVNFTVTSDDGTDRKTFLVKGVAEKGVENKPQVKELKAGTRTQTSFERMGNVKAKAQM